MDTSQADRSLRRLGASLSFANVLWRSCKYLELLPEKAQRFGQVFLVARKGEGYGRRGGYGGNLLPGHGTSGTNDDGFRVRVGRTWRIALLGLGNRVGLGLGMRRRRQWHQRWLMVWRRRRHSIVIRNAVRLMLRRRRRNVSSGIGSTRDYVAILCTWYVLLRLTCHRSRYTRSVRAVSGCGILRWGRRVSARRRRRTGEAVHAFIMVADAQM